MLYNPGLDRRPPGEAGHADTRAPRPARHRRSLLAYALWAVAIFLLLLIALIAGVAFLISRHVALPFLSNQVDAVIEQALGEGYAASVGATVIEIDPVLGLVLRVSDIVVADTEGNEVIRVPSTLLAVDPLAIVTPRAVIRSVEVDGLWATLRWGGGGVVLGTGNTPVVARRAAGAQAVGPANGAAPLADAAPGALADDAFNVLSDPIEALDRSLAEVLDFSSKSGFEHIYLYGAEIDLWRTGSEAPQRFSRADLRFEASPVDGRLNAALSASGYSGRWSVTADRLVNPADASRTLSIVFSQLTMADFFGATVTTNIPFYGRAMIRLSPDGIVEGGGASIDLGSGYFAFGSNVDPILLDRASILLRWDVPRNTIFIENSPFDFGPSHAVLTGWIKPDGPSGSGRFAFDIGSSDVLLAPRDSTAPPLDVDEIRLVGRADLDEGLVHIDRAAIVTPQGSLMAAGSIGLEAAGPSIALSATLSEMPISVFKQLWPAGIQDGGRRWMLDQVTAGTILGGTLEAEMPAGALSGEIPMTPEMLRIEIELEGVAFKTFDGMPEVRNADGVAVVAGAGFGADIVRGQIVSPTGDIIDITAAAFAIDETDTRVPLAHLEAQAVGLTRAFGGIADADPINALEPFEMPPMALAGDASARMSAVWPLVEGMTIDEVQWLITLELTDLASPVPIEGRLVRSGNVTMDITADMVTVRGAAIVDNVPANVDFAFPLVPEVNGRQQIRMVLDEDARRQLGFNLEGFLGGTVLASVADLGPAEIGQHYDLDLGPARVSMPPLGWTKGVGVPATMSFDIVQTPDGYHLRDLVLTGNGFGFTGEAFLDRDYGIVRAVVHDFRLRTDDSFGMTLEREGNGFRVVADGPSVDVRGLIAEGLDTIDTLGAPGAEPSDFAFVGRFGRLIGFNGEVIQDARLSFSSVDGVIRLVELSGTLNGQPVNGVYAEPAGVAGLDVYIGDAGGFLSFMNVYTHARGGALRMTGQEYADDSIRGQLAMTDFVLVDEPVLERLIAQPTPEGGGPSPDRVPFEGLTFDYILLQSRLTIEDALLRGGDLGAIGAGWVDLSAGAFSISGTYIPAYGLNNMFGRIPILGLALGGGNREGLIGVTFRVSGPFDNPQMEVNPLSAIAPGIFRKIFQFQ